MTKAAGRATLSFHDTQESTVIKLQVSAPTVAPPCPFYQELLAREMAMRNCAKGIADNISAAQLFDRAIAIQRSRLDHLDTCATCSSVLRGHAA
jgi:hypothetical protein